MQLKVIRFAGQLNGSVVYRQIFFLSVTIFSIMVIGYHFGSFDQSVHIPFLKATVDPSLYINDPFIELRKNQFSYFWNLFLPFVKSGHLELAVFLAHFASIFLFYQAVWHLGMTLFQNPTASLFAVLSFIIPHTGFVGFPVIEFSLQSRTFVLPFLIFSFDLFLNKHYELAFLLLGLAFNFNLLITNFILLSMTVTFLIQIRRTGFRKPFSAIFFFFLGAMPVLIWKLQTGEQFKLAVHPGWFSAITNGALYHVFYLFSLKPYIFLTIGGICCIMLFHIANSEESCPNHHNSMRVMMISLVGIMIFQTFSTLFFQATSLIQLQLNRASHFILIFSYLSFAGHLARQIARYDFQKENLMIQLGCFWLSPSPIIPLITHSIVQSKNNPFPGRKILALVSLAGLFIISITLAVRSGMWQPGFINTDKDRAWVDVQQWAKAHTSKDAVFITPPQEVGLYQPDWRVFSERATVASLYDLFEIALKPEYFPEWKERFEQVAPGTLQQFNGIFFENQRITRNAYLYLSQENIEKIAKRYQASYFIAESGVIYNYRIVYRNAYFQIFMTNSPEIKK